MCSSPLPLSSPFLFWEVGRPPASSQPPCRRAGPKSGVAAAVKLSVPLMLETGHSRSSPPPQWAPQTDEPPRAAPATLAKNHSYAVPRDSSDEGGSGPEHR